MKSFFQSIQEYPSRQDANGVVMRTLDGLGYRYYWATEGLREEDYTFSPGNDCMTIEDLILHVWGLAKWMHENLLKPDPVPSGQCPQPIKKREEALIFLKEIRDHLEKISTEELFASTIKDRPFWHYLNGPLADALTHVGQITSFRRINGNPVFSHSVFNGH
jgi:hypothetical protein